MVDHGFPPTPFLQFSAETFPLLYFSLSLRAVLPPICLTLLLFPSTLPIRINSSNPFFQIMCPRNSSCLFLMIINNVCLVSALLRNSSFDIRCVHDILASFNRTTFLLLIAFALCGRILSSFQYCMSG